MRNMVLRVLIAALALAGLVVSVMALRVHNMDPAAAPPCAVSEHWDCGAVNHSRFAVFPPRSYDEDAGSKKLHIPVATVGIAGYSLMLVLALLGRFWIVLQLAEIGFAAACFLSYLEAFVLEKWCIYCVWSQGIVTVLLLTTVAALILRRREA
ncbi:vitamin K epoxide reductase family protein [Granulicella sp. WH15]|uniref:vitamin K epoxide reductase family protein n=1 Tax=Granulicella sp. WH15 TaxID=2602070 RepID=UPI0013671954|nr:vitamin K epoxide reductase family protein [Granulicella sp. WH15]QHN02486.1 vitamin K epoxide reductase family protein [Granulicella sp. WH15]